MAYANFHKLHEDLEGCGRIEPVFYDTDGSPVYEDPWGALVGAIVAQNDIATLRLYHSNPETDIWYEHYEVPSWHPVFIAARNGSMEALRVMLDIYVTDPRYVEPLKDYMKRIRFSPIHAACVAADRDLVLWLLQHDPPLATLYDRDTLGKTPLFSAAEGLGCRPIDTRCTEDGIAKLNKHEDFIYFLLDQGCSIPGSDLCSKLPNGDDEEPVLANTVLGAAIPNASYKMVSRLLEDADIHAQQMWRDTPPWLHYNNIHCARQTTALHIAARYWNIEGIRALLDCCDDANAIDMASKRNEDGQIPLHWALAGPKFENWTQLSRGESLSEYLLSRRTESVKLLLGMNFDTVNMRDNKGATCFNYAMRSDAELSSLFPIVKMLIDAKPVPSILNAPNPAGTTVLQDAVTYHSKRLGELHDEQFIELIETLIANGANAHLCLHTICDHTWEESITPALIDRLLELSDVNDIDAAGCTAMHYLVRRLDQLDAARYLITRGANVNIINNNGNSSLHEVMRGLMVARPPGEGMRDPRPRDTPLKTIGESLKMLEQGGGSIDQPNAAGKTPIQLLNELTDKWTQKWAADDQRKALAKATGFGRGQGPHRFL